MAASERRMEFFDAVVDEVTGARPDRFRANPRRSYMYFHDEGMTYLDIYVSLQRPNRLAVACETVPSRPDTYEALVPHVPEIEALAGFPEPLDLTPPGAPGERGPIQKGVLAWRRARPDLSTDIGLAEAVEWTVPRVLGLHAAIEPFWPTGPARGSTSGSGQRADRVRTVSAGTSRRFRAATVPDPTCRLVDGEATLEGLREHEATVARLDELVRQAGYRPLYDGTPRVDIAWESDDGLVVIVEVKSITPLNERHQLRLGLGQILDYASTFRATGWRVLPVLAVSRPVEAGNWRAVCESVGVRFVASDSLFELLLPPPASAAGSARRSSQGATEEAAKFVGTS